MTSKLETNLIEPSTGTALALGQSTQNMVVGADSINVNTLKDAGGNTIFVSNGSGSLSSVNSAFGGAWVLLSTQTASNSAYVDFTTAITGAFTTTYKEYLFEWINVTSSDDGQNFFFNATTDGTNYNVSKVSSAWWLKHDGGTTEWVSKTANFGKEDETVDQLLVWGIGNASGEGSSGSMHLYDPAGTTYVKSWISKASEKVNTEYPIQTDIQGYLNTTSAITGIRFLCDSGNVDTGTIKMYGIK